VSQSHIFSAGSSTIVGNLQAQSSAGWLVPHSQRHSIANAETWTDDRSEAWQHISLVSQSHIFTDSSVLEAAPELAICKLSAVLAG
jgi:hypothetical protein